MLKANHKELDLDASSLSQHQSLASDSRGDSLRDKKIFKVPLRYGTMSSDVQRPCVHPPGRVEPGQSCTGTLIRGELNTPKTAEEI
jgi:hypothetical protein